MRSLPALGVALALVLSAMPAHAAPRERRAHPEGHGLVVAGVAITIGSVAAYGLLGAGLAVGNRAEQDLSALTGRDDIDRRRDVMARGATGNRLAIAGGILAAAMMATGLPLIFVGRRRATASSRTAHVTVGVQGYGAFARVRF